MKRQIPVNITAKEFTFYAKKPLVADDVNSYEIVLTAPYDFEGVFFSITALRPDGVVISGGGSGNAYILPNNMYSVPGETVFRLSIIKDATVLTDAELICEVVEGNGEPDISGEDRIPVLSSLIAQASSATNRANEAAARAEAVSSADIIVAAENSSDFDKARARFVCEGEHDEDIIAEAISLLPNGGTVYLCPGTYGLGSELNLGNNIILKCVSATLHAHALAPVKLGSNSQFIGINLQDVSGASNITPLIAEGENILIQDVKIEKFTAPMLIGGDGQSKNITLDRVTYNCHKGIEVKNCDYFSMHNSNITMPIDIFYSETILKIYSTTGTSDFARIENSYINSWHDETALIYMGNNAVISNNYILGGGGYLITGNYNVVENTNMHVWGYDTGIIGNYNRVINCRAHNEVEMDFEITGFYNRVQNNTFGSSGGETFNLKVSGTGNIVLGNMFGGLIDNGTDTIKDYSSGNFIV